LHLTGVVDIGIRVRAAWHKHARLRVHPPTFQSQSASHRVRLRHADGSPPNIILTRQVIG